MNDELIKADNYGEALSKVLNKKLISYIEFGSYQGNWIAVFENTNNLEIWKGYYGSCSGCDFLQGESKLNAEKDWESGKISIEKVKEYFKDDKPYIIIPKDKMKDMTLETFKAILPANIADDIYEFNPKKLYETIKRKKKTAC